MAIFTRTANPNPSGMQWNQVTQFQVNGTPTATLLRLNNTDGTINEFVGTGFTFDAGGRPTGGVISSITQLTAIGGLPIRTLVYGPSDTAHTLDALFASAPNTGQYLFDGNDQLFGNDGGNTLLGQGGNDTAFGGGGGDSIEGGVGDDTLVGDNDPFAQSIDTLDGGDGNDTFYGERSDQISGGIGIDFLYAVNDFAWSINLATTSIEWMRAGFGGDSIDAGGQTQSVEVYAGGGDDTVGGSAFADIIWAGVGNDTVFGNGGDDVIVGDLGADSLSGGDGNDQLYVDADDTSINGGAGTDAVYIAGGSGMTVNMTASAIEWIADFAGGNDTLDGSGLAVDMTAYASGGTDVVTGGSGNDFLWGEAGTDTVTGNAGNDVLVGGTGADVLTGGAGIDAIYANSGGGGDGALDRVVYGATGWGTDFVFDFEAGTDKLDMSALGTSFASLSIANVDGHAYVSLGADLIAVANAGSTLAASDFIF